MQNFRSHMFSDTVKKDKNNWLNHKLKFHIDSQRAYSIQDNKDKAKDKTEEWTLIININKDMIIINNFLSKLVNISVIIIVLIGVIIIKLRKGNWV